MRHTLTLRYLAAALLLAPCLSAAALAQEAPLPPPKALEAPGTDGPQASPDPDAKDPEAKAPEAKAGPEDDTASKAEGPQDRDAMLAELYSHLATAPDAEHAAPIAKTIEGLWLHSGSDTIGVLMRRAITAINDKKPDLAVKLLDAVVVLAPDYAEGWSRRAYLYYLQNDYERAVGDLRRALALDPNHFRALDGLARILRDSGQKKNSLKVYKQLLRIYPHFPGADDAVEELSVEVEGRGI